MTLPSDGYAIVPQWLLRLSDVTRTEIALYAVLDAYADHKTRQAYPSVATLARDIGMSNRRTVRDGLSALARHGAIDIAHRARQDAPDAWAHNLYTVYRLSPTDRGLPQ